MADPLRKRCLYETLGLKIDSSPDEIRSSYRRLALKLHPDKLAAANGGVATPASTAAFQEVLHAYEVLSDPKERAYYDSHRSRILFSDPSSTAKSHKSSFFDVDLFAFFSNSAFSGFSDSHRGFYKVYGDLFAKLYAQELLFAKEMRLGHDAVPAAPLVGNLDSPYKQVTAFYNYWLSFNTVMDFGWVGEYDAEMGADRRSRRMMEEENKKVRKKAKREYNDSVRGLAAFVKKRDKRVIDMQIKKKLEEEKRREEEKAKKKEEARRRMEQAMAYEDPEWARGDNVVAEMTDESDDEENKKKRGKGGEEFYCVVCSKKFKSDMQWKNHEQSKKHKDKVAELKTAFKDEEGFTLGGKVEEIHVSFDSEPPVEADDSFTDAVDELCEEMKDDLELQDEGTEDVTLKGTDPKSDFDDDVSMLEAMLSGRKNRKSRYASQDGLSSHESIPRENDDQSSMANDTRRKNRKNRASRRVTGMVSGTEDVREESNEVSEDQSEVENQEHKTDDVGQLPSCPVEEADVRKSKGDQVSQKNQKHKKQQVDAKLTGKKDTNIDLKASSKGRKQKGSSKAPNTACETCGEIFDTRNKLFAHLGDSGHSMLKSR